MIKSRIFRVLTATFFIFVIFGLQVVPVFAYISDGANAINVVGMVNTQTGLPVYDNGTQDNDEGSPNQRGLSRPTDIVIDPTDHRLFVSDRQNNRIMVYNLNSSNVLVDYTADNVLGQLNFTASAAATTQIGLEGPFQLAYDDTNNYLFVADYNNSRVLVYDVTVIVNGESAAHVLGQPGFTSATAATTQSGLSTPIGLAYDGTHGYLFVSDTGNNRIVAYNTADGISDGENAERVLGQGSDVNKFTSSAYATTAAGLYGPREVAYSDGVLAVADNNNKRVLLYDAAAITDGESAINVLGQANFTSAASATTASGLTSADGVFIDSTNSRIFVNDTSSNRVLVYGMPVTDGESASNVLGQAVFTTSTSGTTQGTLNGPAGVFYESTSDDLYVSDFANNRVMVFDVAVNPGGGSAPEFNMLTLAGILIVGLYVAHRIRLKPVHAVRRK